MNPSCARSPSIEDTAVVKTKGLVTVNSRGTGSDDEGGIGGGDVGNSVIGVTSSGDGGN